MLVGGSQLQVVVEAEGLILRDQHRERHRVVARIIDRLLDRLEGAIGAADVIEQAPALAENLAQLVPGDDWHGILCDHGGGLFPSRLTRTSRQNTASSGSPLSRALSIR